MHIRCQGFGIVGPILGLLAMMFHAVFYFCFLKVLIHNYLFFLNSKCTFISKSELLSIISHFLNFIAFHFKLLM